MKLPAELQNLIMDHSSLPDLEILGATNSILRSLVRQHILQRTTNLFRSFELDPLVMLDVLNHTRSVVSGSAALAVINPWSFTPNDIDIYVPRTHDALLIELMSTRFGYNVASISNVYPSFSSISTIYNLTNGAHSVQIMVTESANPLAALFRFHSTVVMNFISAHGVYSAYPILTSQRRGLKNQYELTHHSQSHETVRVCFDKYKERGYEIADNLSDWPEFNGHVCTLTGSCPGIDRYVDDRHAYFHRFSNASPENKPNRVFSSGIDRPVWCLERPATSLLNIL